MSARALGAAALLLLGGCAQTFDATRIGVPVTMASAAPTAGGTKFRVSQHATYAFWGLSTVTSPALDRVLKRQLVGASAIRDLKVTTKSRWPDILFTVLTAGLIVPRTVEVQGVVVGDSTAVAPAR